MQLSQNENKTVANVKIKMRNANRSVVFIIIYHSLRIKHAVHTLNADMDYVKVRQRERGSERERVRQRVLLSPNGSARRDGIGFVSPYTFNSHRSRDAHTFPNRYTQNVHNERQTKTHCAPTQHKTQPNAKSSKECDEWSFAQRYIAALIHFEWIWRQVRRLNNSCYFTTPRRLITIVQWEMSLCRHSMSNRETLPMCTVAAGFPVYQFIGSPDASTM